MHNPSTLPKLITTVSNNSKDPEKQTNKQQQQKKHKHRIFVFFMCDVMAKSLID